MCVLILDRVMTCCIYCYLVDQAEMKRRKMKRGQEPRKKVILLVKTKNLYIHIFVAS